MNSRILNYIGLGNIDIGFLFLGLAAISLILLIIIIAALVQIHKFKKKYEKFMLGKDGGSLEDDIMTLYDDNKLWCRPYDMFLDEVNLNGQKYRFELQDIESVATNFQK